MRRVTKSGLAFVLLQLLSCSDSSRNAFEADGPLPQQQPAPEQKNCADVFAETKRAVDIIMSIDQSGSMSNKIESLNENINLLPSLLTESGLDYRLVMVAEIGRNEFQVCVPPPLGVDCGTNGNLFRTSDRHIESNDMLKILLSTFNYPVAAIRWKEFLRPGVLKVFVPITDDESTELEAGKFDTAIRHEGAPLFGTAEQRNYMFFPVIGAKDFPDTTKCVSGVDSGRQYQLLTKWTNGKWFSICRPSLRDVLEEIGKTVRETVSCEIAVPEPPAQTTLDLTKVNVQVTDANGTVIVPQDSRPCDGGADGWQFSADKKKIFLCGNTCTSARSNPTAKFSVGFSCNTIVR